MILKNRNAPQLRILHNSMKNIGHSIAFRLRGRKAIATASEPPSTRSGNFRQTKYLQAGSGFRPNTLRKFFLVLKTEDTLKATILWPGGLSQKLEGLPVNHRIEIEEGLATFVAKPFAAPPQSYSEPGPPPPLEPLPSVIDTWLIEPLKAPEFSLPDLDGNIRELQSFQGGCVLLNFWATKAPQCRDELRRLHQHKSSFAGNKLSVVAINVDDASDAPSALSFAKQLGLSFPVLFASNEVAGIFNIIYRYLFDRRRDLALPTSFLLNSTGMIVKLYQGPVDLKIARGRYVDPSIAADRAKALPFNGLLCQDAFQRNEFTMEWRFSTGYPDAAAASFQQVIVEKPDDPKPLQSGHTQPAEMIFNRPNNILSRQSSCAKLSRGMEQPGMIAQQDRPMTPSEIFQSLAQRPTFAIALLNMEISIAGWAHLIKHKHF